MEYMSATYDNKLHDFSFTTIVVKRDETLNGRFAALGLDLEPWCHYKECSNQFCISNCFQLNVFIVSPDMYLNFTTNGILC
jgi:hypothetical protein